MEFYEYQAQSSICNLAEPEVLLNIIHVYYLAPVTYGNILNTTILVLF